MYRYHLYIRLYDKLPQDVSYVVCVAESWRLQGGAHASLDAVLESVVVFRLATGAVAEVVILYIQYRYNN